MFQKLFAVVVLQILLMSSAEAGTFYILVSADNGMETVDEIYEEFNSNNEQTLLSIFNEFPPYSLEYGLFIRPTIPPSNPDTPSGSLYRRLLVDYLYPMDVSPVLDYFENSPFIESVFYDGNVKPIIITPDSPIAGDSITFEMALLPGICPNIAGLSTDPLGRATDVSVSGNSIILDASIYVRPPGQPVGCNGERPYSSFSLGELSAGTYQIQINTVNDTFTFPVNNSERSFVYQTTLTVRGAEPISVPAFSVWAIVLLVFALMLMPLLNLYHLRKFKF